MVSQDQIQQLVKEIAEGYQPEKIYLFGSYANGVPNYDSDIDLFIVKETAKRRNERTVDVVDSIKNYIWAMDIIVYTPEELENAMTQFMNIGKIAVNTGKLMYERV
ncbi:MAG TPA: nucleotidyltransferase domain-containing protein [Puia sp.]|jgi:predicted nucleotidyltransferase|nr:nucleotidyltransferase domain-containing protein [Puia sp.]